MKKRYQTFRKASLIMGVVTLMLGLLPLTSLPGASVIFADDTPPGPQAEMPENAGPKTGNPPGKPESEEPVVEEPPMEDPILEEPPLEEPGKEEILDEIIEEPLLKEEPLMLMMMSAPIGDDPNISSELPDFGNNYNQGDCVTNASCEPSEPVTNPNEYTDQGTYGEKEYLLPSISGNTANIVAIKEGNDWYFFKKGSGETCVGTTFCVEFDDLGNVSVYSYQTQGNGYKGYNLIHFWYVAPPPDGGDDIYGCMDPEATNYNRLATVDDQSCEYPEDPCECEGFQALALITNGECECDDEVYGCPDPEAINYNPEATVDDQSCEYEDPGDPGDPGDPENPGGPGIPGGSGGPSTSLVLIPVTGADFSSGIAGLQALLRNAGMAFMGAAAVAEGLSRRKTR